MAKRIVARIGDLNPTDYGGGVVFKSGLNEWIEYTHGVEVDCPHWDEDSDEECELGVYTVVVDDVDWYDPKDIYTAGRTAGLSRDEIDAILAKNTLDNRIACVELYAMHWGWADAAGGYVEPASIRDLEKRWKL